MPPSCDPHLLQALPGGPNPCLGTPTPSMGIPGHPKSRLVTPTPALGMSWHPSPCRGPPNPCHGHPNPCRGRSRAHQNLAVDTPKPWGRQRPSGYGGADTVSPQEQAFESSQKYKEGKFIIEMSHMVKENGWD